jgi:hypothetical protein
MKKNQINEVEFKNSIGQTIKTGDEIVIITSGYAHRVNINRGTYLGRHGSDNGRCSCNVYKPKIRYRHNDTGIEVVSWYSDKRIKEIPYPRFNTDINRASTEEYQAELDRYNLATKEYHSKINDIMNEYTKFEIPAYRRTTLQLNRIFKIDTQASELKI